MGAGRYTPRAPPSTAPAPSSRSAPFPTSSSKPVSNVSNTKKPEPAASMSGSSMSTARNHDMNYHTCGGKGHFKRDFPNRKVMFINDNDEYETGDDADPDAPEDDDYDSDGVDAFPSEARTIVVSQRALNVQPSASTQRCNLFQTKALVGPDKACKVIIDGGSCRNLASKELCDKLKLKNLPHSHPYYIQWLSDNGEMKVNHMVHVDFKIGPYEEEASIARGGEEQLDKKLDVKLDMELAMKLDMKTSHGRADTGWPMDTAASRPTSPPRGPMTRARAQALRQEVNSLLSTYDLDTPWMACYFMQIPYVQSGTSTKTQAMETKTLERELETMKMELLHRPNFRRRPELPARFLQDAPKMPSSAQEKASDRNFRPEGPELPPTRNFRPSSPQLPLSFRNINNDDGTPRIQAVHLTPSTIASSRSSATVIKCGEGNQLPMTRHQHWIATQAVHAKLNQFEAMLKDTNVRYEERAQVQRIDLNNQVQELNEKIETQGNELKATLAIQGHELLHRRIMIPIKTHATIMWMLKCFNNKLKKRSKHDFDLSKNFYALKKNAFNKRISMLNSKRNNNVFVMIKISFMHVSKKGSAKSKRHVIIKGNLAHLKWPMLKGTTIMPNKKRPPHQARDVEIDEDSSHHQASSEESVRPHQRHNNDDQDEGHGRPPPPQQQRNNNEDAQGPQPQPQQRQAHGEERPPPRRNDRNEEEIFGKLKFTMPKFQGEEDPDAYLSWVLKVDKIFRIHNFSEAKKVAMASLEFEGYANVWWEEVNKKREKEDLAPIDTWEEMQEVMHTRFVPTHHKRDLFNKLTQLKQSYKSVEEYYKEMHMTMMSANVDEREEQTMARFLNGLNIPVKRIVEFFPYKNMVELLHQATRAERQVREDLASAKTKTFFAARNAMNASSSIKNTSTLASKDPPKQARSAIKTTSFKPEQSTMSSKASTGSSNITCFKCGAQGHKSFECKNTRVMITRDDGDVEYLSEGEYEALVQAATSHEDDALEDQEQVLCVHDASPSLVVTKVLTTHTLPNEDQRCNIFQTRAGINGKSIKVIIDGGSCHNLASTELCTKLNLPLRKHPHPYHVQWLSDNGNVKIQHTVTISFKIGAYEDTVDCDVVPMTVCHMLLGRPWQYDKKANHDGYTNAYSFKVNDKTYILRPMTPSQVIADNAKALARAKEATITSELRGERVIHQKESERHKPYVSEMKSVLLATKSEMREVHHNPSTTLHYVLICKGPSAETNDLTNIPSSLNPSNEIFSELDEINARFLFCPEASTPRAAEGGPVGPDDRVARPGPGRATYGVGLRPPRCPFAYKAPTKTLTEEATVRETFQSRRREAKIWGQESRSGTRRTGSAPEGFSIDTAAISTAIFINAAAPMRRE
ncbi:hypothetical protein QYE76_007643 [Lolium multiflorum]|uniref:CCHC-type domain-containing protein n=1 Tax=Lolium multiflorum TaxID=4521 RepID=A0AAD8QF15_LOLMU|nr:hypothetical protein QYE76_007643 [Lolium multiflorum]